MGEEEGEGRGREMEGGTCSRGEADKETVRGRRREEGEREGREREGRDAVGYRVVTVTAIHFDS